MTVCACGRSTNNEPSICDRCTALVTFGLTNDATQADIKDAYRVLAKVWHPDRFQGDERLKLKAEDKLKEINSAYQLLTTTSAEDTHRRPSRPEPQPREPQPTAETNANQQAYSWPATTQSFRIRRHAARIRRAIAVLVVIIAAAWAVQRYGPTLALRFSNSVAARGVSTSPAVTTVQQQPVANAAAAADKPTRLAAHTRTTAAASERPSLLVYPADDPRVPYFTVGSTRDDVVKVQGAPTKIAGNVFEYGLSEVFFQDGRVQSWHADPSSPLKARMPE